VVGQEGLNQLKPANHAVQKVNDAYAGVQNANGTRTIQCPGGVPNPQRRSREPAAAWQREA